MAAHPATTAASTPPPTALYTYTFLLALLITSLVVLSLRILAILSRQRSPNKWSPPPAPAPTSSSTRGRNRSKSINGSSNTATVLIVLGSGGHTHEMFRLLRDLDTRRYVHRTYVVSSGDALSGVRAAEFEKGLEEGTVGRWRRSGYESPPLQLSHAPASTPTKQNGITAAPSILPGANQEEEDSRVSEHHNLNTPSNTHTLTHGLPNTKHTPPPNTGPSSYTIHTLPRARAIHQPLSTTPLTALRSFLAAFPILLPPAPSDLPDLVLTNGPGTAATLIYASFVLRVLDVRGAESRRRLRCIYVESFARVRSLSLSARLVAWCVDRFVVQWEGLSVDGANGGGGWWWLGARKAEYRGVLV